MADDALDILAWTMLGEAGGEGPQGMADVGHVVLNRLNSGKYGRSITDVALAPKQFSTWNSGAGGNNPKGRYPRDSAEFKRARQLAEQVISGAVPGPPGRPLDYNADNIKPYWADSKSRNGSYTRNGHTFYPSVPVPPESLPEVATLTDTVPQAPLPVTASPNLAQMRATPREMPSLPLARPQTPPSDLISRSMASLPRPTANLGDSLAMSPIQGGRAEAPLYDAAFDSRTGQMRMTRGGPYQGFGNDVGQSKAPAPVPASAYDRVTARNNNLPPMPSRLPDLPPSTVGQSPATRVVQSVPVPSARAVPGQSFAGMERAPSLPKMGTPDLNAIYAGIYPSEPGPYRIGGNAPNVPTTAPSAGLSPAQVANIGVGLTNTVDPITRLRMADTTPTPVRRPGAAPTPMPTISRNAVATQLDTGTPLPRPRPQMGMGGVDMSRSAPIPAPRLERGGIFGNPKIGSWEVPLPGVFGVLQNATKAMNNASGPFNNGGDNALYNLMRGGDFNTPGAATAQAGGFLFAPKDGGGWLNVGRAPNYAAINGGGSSSSGSSGGMSSVRGENKYDPDTNSWSRK